VLANAAVDAAAAPLVQILQQEQTHSTANHQVQPLAGAAARQRQKTIRGPLETAAANDPGKPSRYARS